VTRRLSRAESGNAVFGCLMAGDATIEEGVAATGLSYAQWRSGLGYIRDVLVRNPDALVYDASSQRYSLNPAEAERYIGFRVQLFAQALRTLYDGRFVPPGLPAASPVIHSFRLMDTAVEELISDLEETARLSLSDPDVRMIP